MLHTRLLLITGCPRSGTRYTAKVLRAAKLKIRHEGIGLEGTVSGLHAVDDYIYMYGAPAVPMDQLEYEHVWMQVRHPLKTIPSLTTLNLNFWRWQEHHTGIEGNFRPPMLKAARFWLKWTELAEKRRPEWVYRVEDFEQLWPEILTRLGREQRPLPEFSTLLGTRRHDNLTWEDLIALDHGLAHDILKRADEFGYEV